MTLGEHLRALRKQRGYTLKTVAEKAGFTASLISQIERDLVDPPISTLGSISKALDVSLLALIDDDAFLEAFDQNAVTRKDQRVKVGSAEFGAVHSLLNPYKNRKMDVMLIEAEAGGSSGPGFHTHVGEEFEYVIQGIFEVEWNGKTYTLQEGDSLYIDSSKPHRWKNAGEKKMVVLAALIPSKSWPPLADY